MRIAPIAERELDDYAGLAAQHTMFEAYGLTPEKIRAAMASPTSSENLVLIAEVSNEPAGFIWLVKRGAFSRSGYIRLLVIASAYLGTGVSDKLMDAAEVELMHDGSDVLLLVNSSNDRARRFYERRGYREVGVLEDYAVSGETECIYRKRGDMTVT